MEKFVLFEAGQEKFAIPMTMVLTIESAGALLPGGATSGARQDIAFRGRSVPMVDMTRLLGGRRNSATPEERKILLLNGQTAPMAILVDRLKAVAEADAGNVLQMPPEVEEPAVSYFPQVLRNSEGLVFLLNPEEVLGPNKAAVSHDTSLPSSGLSKITAFPESPRRPLQPGRRPGRVFLSSLREETHDNKRLMVLFSPLQIEEILRSLQVQPVPFTPGYTEGIVVWRGRVLPVMSLESRLGFTTQETARAASSYAVVRMPASPEPHAGAHYGILKVGRSIREMKLPIDCRPMTEYPMGIDPALIRGLYEWDDGVLLVPNLEQILRRI